MKISKMGKASADDKKAITNLKKKAITNLKIIIIINLQILGRRRRLRNEKFVANILLTYFSLHPKWYFEEYLGGRNVMSKAIRIGRGD